MALCVMACRLAAGPAANRCRDSHRTGYADPSYFLARSRKGVYQLLSNVCPHQAEEVVDWSGVFMCPAHGWRFEYTEGVCVNGPNAKMVGFPVSVENGRLIAELPDD